MKANKVVDDALGEATIRSDGLTVGLAYLCEVKQPDESKSVWDKVLTTIPVEQAWRPLAEGGCKLGA